MYRALTVHGEGVGSTIIQDNADGSRLFDWNCGTTGLHRLTGIEFEDGGRSPVFQSTVTGLINFFCSNLNARFRIDHNKFDNLIASPAFAPNGILGVMDHNEFLFSGSNTPIYCFSQYWGGVGNYGDNSWTATKSNGTEGWFFIEDNTFTRAAGGVYAMFDGILGCRAVIRKNTGTRVEISAHGTDTGGRNRGTRALEIYDNTLDKGGEACSAILDQRSGAALAFRNTLDNCGSWIGSPKVISLVDDRMTASFNPWGSADGTNTWDVNHASNPFVSGTVGSAVPFTLTVSPSPGWTTNQWVGYVVKKTASCTGNCSSIITSNTADTVVFSGTDGHGSALDFSAGNTFQINRVTETFDQPGRGYGTLVENSDTPTPPAVSNDQTDDPVYEWLNTADSVSIHSIQHLSCGFGAGSTAVCRENEHFYNYKGSLQTTSSSPFNGTTGVGAGIISRRPGTCTTGVGYWATDEGEWDSSNGATADGRLYLCTSTNTWTLSYTPYTYPHSLVDDTPPVSGGTGARIRVRLRLR